MSIVRGLASGLDDSARDEAMAELRRRVVDHETADGVVLGSSAWLITADRS